MIRVGDEGAFVRLCEVEGPRYEANQRLFRAYAFGPFLAAWREREKALHPVSRRLPSWAPAFLRGLVLAAERRLVREARSGLWLDVPDHGLPGHWNSVIYGYHGWNRYLVRRRDGAMFFITGQAATQAHVEKAKAQGFLLFPEEIDTPLAGETAEERR